MHLLGDICLPNVLIAHKANKQAVAFLVLSRFKLNIFWGVVVGLCIFIILALLLNIGLIHIFHRCICYQEA